MSRTAYLWAQPRTTVRQDRNRVHQLTTLTYSAGSGTHPGLGSCPRPAALGAGRGGAGLQGFIPETLNHSTIVDAIEGQKKHNFFLITLETSTCSLQWLALPLGPRCLTGGGARPRYAWTQNLPVFSLCAIAAPKNVYCEKPKPPPPFFGWGVLGTTFLTLPCQAIWTMFPAPLRTCASKQGARLPSTLWVI